MTTITPASYKVNTVNFPWTSEFTPVTERHGGDCPAYRMQDADGRIVCAIDQDMPEAFQAAQDRLIAAVHSRMMTSTR